MLILQIAAGILVAHVAVSVVRNAVRRYAGLGSGLLSHLSNWLQ